MPKLKTAEQSYPQTLLLIQAIIDQDRAILDKSLPATYETYRKIRRHPVVAIARAMSIAPIVAADWQVEADDDAPPDAEPFIRSQLMPLRQDLLQTALECGCDYGWAPFEKVFEVWPFEGTDLIGIRSLKPLLVDLTEIMLEPRLGKFAGFRQQPIWWQDNRDIGPYGFLLELPYALLLNFRAEAGHLYGESLLENVRRTYANWQAASQAAERFDRKIAGDHWVVTYPVGATMYNGVNTDNSEIAAAILNALESSGSTALPLDVKRAFDQGGPGSTWSIDLKSASAQQGNFTQRLDYCDKQFCRGLLVPERMVMEGQFGTKAEAGVHEGVALKERELMHRHVTTLVNWHVVDQLLALNWGDEARGLVRLVAAPLVDAKQAFVQEVFKLLLANPASFAQAVATLDMDGLIESLGLPRAESVSDAEDSEVQGALLESIRKLYDLAQPALPGANGADNRAPAAA